MNKRFLLTLAIIFGLSAAVAAQPRSAGIRIGATGLDATYQHNTTKNQFIEGNAGIDFGYNANSKAGFKATAIYNFIWARPAWTEEGTWALYAGPGISLGAVDDMAVINGADGLAVGGYIDSGFMVSLVAQVGLEYNFKFPLSLSVDIRPYFGMHINDGNAPKGTVIDKESGNYSTAAGFYDSGLLGFSPSISIRYRF